MPVSESMKQAAITDEHYKEIVKIFTVDSQVQPQKMAQILNFVSCRFYQILFQCFIGYRT